MFNCNPQDVFGNLCLWMKLSYTTTHWILNYNQNNNQHNKTVAVKSVSKKVKNILSASKVMTINFLNSQKIIMTDYLKKDKTITVSYYTQ